MGERGGCARKAGFPLLFFVFFLVREHTLASSLFFLLAFPSGFLGLGLLCLLAFSLLPSGGERLQSETSVLAKEQEEERARGKEREERADCGSSRRQVGQSWGSGRTEKRVQGASTVNTRKFEKKRGGHLFGNCPHAEREGWAQSSPHSPEASPPPFALQNLQVRRTNIQPPIHRERERRSASLSVSALEKRSRKSESFEQRAEMERDGRGGRSSVLFQVGNALEEEEKKTLSNDASE